MKKTVRLFLFLLCAALLLALVPGAALAEGDTVTRAEWVSALVSTFSMTVEGDDYPDNYYSDLSEENPHYRDILVAVEFGVVDLAAGEAFEPDAPATRAFAAETLVYCLGFQPEEGEAYVGLDADFAAQIALARGWFTTLEGDLAAAEKETMLADAAAILASDVIDESYESSCSFDPAATVFPEETMIAEDDSGALYIYDTSRPLKAGETKISLTMSSGSASIRGASPMESGGALEISRTGTFSLETLSRIEATTVMHISTDWRKVGGPGMVFSMSRACIFMTMLN